MSLEDYFYLFNVLDIDNSSELLASKPSTQPNINYGSEKISVEEFLPNESKRRATPLIPIRSKTPIDSTRAQTMSQYDLLEASDHI